ncbi:hypothetical protein [Streptomyces sp. NPDC048663]|uniref:hypothetical protein n=1 Tax=Streptomyces sp. NPDC048663 TaxID=3155638 RepID=UPI003446C6AD
MTTDLTDAPPVAPDSIGAQQPAVQALAALAAQYPGLPASYITIHSPFELRPGRLDLQLETPQAFELWRDALEIPAADIELHATVGNCWVSAVTQVGDATVELSGYGIRLSLKELTAPRNRDEVSA